MTNMERLKELKPETPAAEAIRLILRTQFDEIRSLRARTPSPHAAQERRDLRAAVRCLSHAFENFKPFINYANVAEVHQTIDNIMNALGEVIDEEVLIKSLVKLEGEIPTELLEGVAVLIGERQIHLDHLLNALSRTLSETEFVELETRFKTSLESALNTSVSVQHSDGTNLQNLARKIILTCLEETESSLGALYRPSKTKAAHRLRISVRRLRHALDLFGHYLGNGVHDFSAELARFEGRLGKLRNSDVKINALGDWLSERHADVIRSAETSPQWDAAMWLLGNLFRRRVKHFRQTLNEGQELLASGFASRVRQRCQPDNHKAEQNPDRSTDFHHGASLPI